VEVEHYDFKSLSEFAMKTLESQPWKPGNLGPGDPRPSFMSRQDIMNTSPCGLCIKDLGLGPVSPRRSGNNSDILLVSENNL